MKRRSSARRRWASSRTTRKLTRARRAMPAWDSLSENSKRLFAHQMEVYAGYSENADHHVGRLLDAIEEMGELDDTLVIWIWGDNGASLEGTPTGTFNEGTMVNGLPLTDEEQMQLALKWGGLGGVGHRDDVPALLHGLGVGGQHAVQMGQAGRLASGRYPQPVGGPLAGQITEPGGLRSQFTHVTDIGPTILDVAGIPQPTHVDGVEQQPMTGVSFADSLADADAAERHTQQYFENFGNRAMYKDGWWLSMRMPRIPWRLDPELLQQFAPGVWNPDDDPVELYYLPDDFSQANDLSAANPEKVKNCRPCSGKRPRSTTSSRSWPGSPPSSGSCHRSAPDDHHLLRRRAERRTRRVPEDLQPLLHDQRGPPHPRSGAEGVIVADANHLGGFALFVQDGRLKHTYAFLGVFEYRQESEGQLPTGDVNVQMTFAADEAKPATGGEVTLSSTASGWAAVAWTTPCRSVSPGTRAWTSAGTTGWSSTGATRRRRRSPLPARSRRWSSTWPPISTAKTS